MHNLGVVIRFEFIRTLKKKSFWLSALAFPAMMGLLFAMIFFSNKLASDAGEKANQEHFTFEVLDKSGLVDPVLIEKYQAKTVDSQQQGINDVKQGKVDAFFYYPSDLPSQPIKVAAQDTGLTEGDKYTNLATALLTQSVVGDLNSPVKVAVLQGAVATDLTTYQDGQVKAGFERVIAPGGFLVLFYIVVVLLANRMLASTTEEKENRVIEMILTSVAAKTLITGKIIAMLLVGVVQILVIAIPAVIGVIIFRQDLPIEAINFAQLTISPQQAIVGIATLVFAFLLMTGCLVAIGAAVPTAKEASGFFGVVMVALFIPLYAAPAIITDPDNILVQAVTYIPLTSPITVLLRNAVDNIPLVQSAISITILAISSLVMISIATRIFSFGTLEYSRKLTLSEILPFSSRK